MNTPASPAAVHMMWKWNAPTFSVMPRHEQSTASRPSAKVSSNMMSVRPSAARKKLMPSDGIQSTLMWAIQAAEAAPEMKAGVPAPLATKSPLRSPAFTIHWTTRITSGAAVPSTAVQRATSGFERPSSHASGAATAGMRM